MPYPAFLGYTKGEIADLKSVVKEIGDVDLSGDFNLSIFYVIVILDYLTSLDEEILKKNKYYDQLENIVVTRPLDMERAPYCEITIKLGKEPISEILEAITDVLFVPFRIGCDFFAAASSPNRPLEIIHPSIGTICNQNKLMRSEDDFDNLFAEFQDGAPVDKILEAHSASRKLIVDSGLKITQILAMRIFISRYVYKN